MKLEDQVCSLELARRLKELGVKQESFFLWMTFRNLSSTTPHERLTYLATGDERYEISGRSFNVEQEHFAAFTVAELGEMLPSETYSLKHWDGWRCVYAPSGPQSEIANTEADARARMLIHLLENKLVKI